MQSAPLQLCGGISRSLDHLEPLWWFVPGPLPTDPPTLGSPMSARTAGEMQSHRHRRCHPSAGATASSAPAGRCHRSSPRHTTSSGVHPGTEPGRAENPPLARKTPWPPPRRGTPSPGQRHLPRLHQRERPVHDLPGPASGTGNVILAARVLNLLRYEPPDRLAKEKH